MTQLDLFGVPLGYHCKCGKAFGTMSAIKKHHAKKKRVKKSINFVLENYQMTVQTIEVVQQ